MIKFICLLAFFLLLSVSFLNVDKYIKASETINDNIYNQCILNADVGDNHTDRGLSGIAYENIDIPKAEKVCIEAFEENPNNTKIIRSLGRIYHLKKEYKISFTYFNKVVEQDAYSQYMLSEMFLNGQGTQKNYKKAFQLAKKSADSNFISAYIVLSDYYSNGWGTKIDYDLAYQSEKKCADYGIRDCIHNMALTYRNAWYDKEINIDKSFFYINKLVDIKDSEGYFLMGTHLINNAKSTSDIENGLLYCKKSGDLCNQSLMNYYLFPDDYPYFLTQNPNEKENKKRAMDIINKIVNDIEEDNNSLIKNDNNITILQGLFTYPYYTSALKKGDLTKVVEKLNLIARNKPQKYKNYLSIIAADEMGHYYDNGYYIKKNTIKSIEYFKLAAERQDYQSAIAVGWKSYLLGNFKEAKYYNDLVISSSNDPYLTVFAHNNNGVIDTNRYGRGTDVAIDQFTKATSLVEKYNYDNSWPLANLFRIYYFPIFNEKKENSKIQNLQKSKEILNKLINLEKNHSEIVMDSISLFSFLIKNFQRLPKNIEEASSFLEYSALSGYEEAYSELAWLYEGYRKDNYISEYYKWFHICTFLEKDEDDNEQCKKDLNKVKSKLSFFQIKQLKSEASDWVSNQGKRLVELENDLKPNKGFKNKNNYDFGKYYALLIGVQDYQDFDNLKTPLKDIKRVGKILSDKFNFKTEYLENPNRVQILKTLNRYTKSLNEKDNFVLYFAGHGMQRSDEGFWIPIDAQKDEDINWISNDSIVRKIREMKARNILVLADACFSGLITRGINSKDINKQKTAIDILNELKTRIAITSGNNEPVLDGGGGENSVFASALSSELINFKEPFTASALFVKLQKKVIKESMAYGNPQNPLIMDIPKSGHENFDFVFNPQ